MKIKVITLQEIDKDIPYNPIKIENLKEYLEGGRQDILINPDIFFENVRTKNRIDKNFSLFEKVDYIDEEVILVFSIYLELFEYFGKSNDMINVIDFYSKKYPNNKIIFSWNHDNDFYNYRNIIEQYNNVNIINMGYTSGKTKNDIIIPFWNINVEEYNEPKNKLISFIGTPNNQCRGILVNNIISYNNPDIFYYNNNLSSENYCKEVSSSKFTLCPIGGRGGGGFSYRFFECLFLNTIPVLIVDNIVFPYENIIDWSKMCIHIEQKYVNNLEYIKYKCESCNYDEIRDYIKNNIHYFKLSGIQDYIFKKLKN